MWSCCTKARCWRSGPPSEVTDVAAGRTFLAEPPRGNRRACRRGCWTIPDRRRGSGGRSRAAGHGRRPQVAAVKLPESSTGITTDRWRRGSRMASWCCYGDKIGGDGKVARRSPVGRPAASGAARRSSNVNELVRKFGAFTAVDHVSFAVSTRRNLRPARVRTAPARQPHSACCVACCRPPPARCASRASICARRAHRRASSIGYVAQKFSLYGQLSVDGEPRFLRRRLWAARQPQARAHRVGAGAVRARPARAPRQRPTAGRLQAAAGDGGGAAARAGNPVPRRADQRRRSAGAARVLAADHRAAPRRASQ